MAGDLRLRDCHAQAFWSMTLYGRSLWKRLTALSQVGSPFSPSVWRMDKYNVVSMVLPWGYVRIWRISNSSTCKLLCQTCCIFGKIRKRQLPHVHLFLGVGRKLTQVEWVPTFTSQPTIWYVKFKNVCRILPTLTLSMKSAFPKGSANHLPN